MGAGHTFIVMDDSDPEPVTRAALFAAVGTAGQRCTSPRRLLVQRGISYRIAKGLIGGSVLDRSGHFVEPTIIKMPADAEILQVETFAPILYLVEFGGLVDAIAIQNGVKQGLSSAIFTDSVSADWA